MKNDLRNGLNERYKYFLFYLRDSGELYAYTDKKYYAKMFRTMRNMEIFLERKIDFSKEDLHELYECEPSNRLILFDFHTEQGGVVTFPITVTERTTVMHVSIQSCTVDLCSIASTIPYIIFSRKIQKYLHIVGYVNNYERFSKGTEEYPNLLQPDYLSTFLHFYKDTLKGGDVK